MNSSIVQQWTGQHKEEIELLRKNELFRKEFLLNLSHELKTLVFAIQGYLDTLLNGTLDVTTVNKKFLANTSKNMDRLVNLLDDLDEITKLESGDLNYTKPISLFRILLRKVLNLFQ